MPFGVLPSNNLWPCLRGDVGVADAAAAAAAVGPIIYSFINFCLFYVNLFIADCPWPPGELITHAACPPRVGIN